MPFALRVFPAGSVAPQGNPKSDKSNSKNNFWRLNVNPLIQLDSLKRLMRNDVEVRNIEISIPRPKNPNYYPENEFNRSIFSAISAAEGDRIRVSISSDARVNPQPRLTHVVKRALRELVTEYVGKTDGSVFLIFSGLIPRRLRR